AAALQGGEVGGAAGFDILFAAVFYGGKVGVAVDILDAAALDGGRRADPAQIDVSGAAGVNVGSIAGAAALDILVAACRNKTVVAVAAGPLVTNCWLPPPERAV